MPLNLKDEDIQWDAPSKGMSLDLKDEEIQWDATPATSPAAIEPPPTILDPEKIVPQWGVESPNLYGVVGGIREIGRFAGLGQIGAAIGKEAAYQTQEGLTPEQSAAAGLTPTTGERVGAGLQAASLALPIGKVAGLGEKVAAKVLSPTAAKLAGGATAGAGAGYLYEAGEKAAEGKTVGETLIPGGTTALGAVIPPAAKGIVTGISKTGAFMTEKYPARVINSLVKPVEKLFSFGKNPGRAVAEEKIVANSVEELTQKITERRNQIGVNLGDVSTQLTSAASQKGITLDITKALDHVDMELAKARRTPNVQKSLIARLEDVKTDLSAHKLKDITFNEALDMKRLVGDVTKWTDNMSDDRTVNAALKRVWGSIKENLNSTASKVDPLLASRYARLNEKYADLTSAEIAAKYRDKIIQRNDLISLKGHVGAAGAGIMTLLYSGGQAIPAIIATAGGAALDKALSSPAVKTRVAAWLAKASPAERNVIYQRVPRLSSAIDRTIEFGKRDVANLGSVATYPTRAPGDIIYEGIESRLRKKPSTIPPPTGGGAPPTIPPPMPPRPTPPTGGGAPPSPISIRQGIGAPSTPPPVRQMAGQPLSAYAQPLEPPYAPQGIGAPVRRATGMQAAPASAPPPLPSAEIMPPSPTEQYIAGGGRPLRLPAPQPVVRQPSALQAGGTPTTAPQGEGIGALAPKVPARKEIAPGIKAKPEIKTIRMTREEIEAEKPIGYGYKSEPAATPMPSDYTKDMPPIKAVKVNINLNENIVNNGRIISRKELANKKVGEGAIIVTGKEGRRLQTPDGSFLAEKDISKTAMDYAEYLIAKKKGIIP